MCSYMLSVDYESSTELIITGVTLSDSALYYCALRVGAQWYKVYVKPYKSYFYSQKLINYVETSVSECDKK